MIDSTALDLDHEDGKAARADVEVHSLSSQLHGGVLLGDTKDERSFEEAYAAGGTIWAPDGRLIFKKVGDEFHFWNDLPTGGSQHAVVTSGKIMDITARRGLLVFKVTASPGAAVRSDLRSKAASSEGSFEWLGLWHGLDGASVVQKLAQPCDQPGPAAACVKVADASFETAVGKLVLEESNPLPAIFTSKADESGQWMIVVNLRRLVPRLRPAEGADANAKISAAKELARWGFTGEALEVLNDALSSVSPDAEDTILHSDLLEGY